MVNFFIAKKKLAPNPEEMGAQVANKLNSSTSTVVGLNIVKQMFARIEIELFLTVLLSY